MYRVGALGRQAGGKDLCLGWKSGRVVGGDDVTEVVGERTKSSGRVSGRAIEQVDSHSRYLHAHVDGPQQEHRLIGQLLN